MLPPSRDEPPPDPHGFRDVIARRRKAAEDDRDRLRSFERACASSREDLRRTARELESTARHRHAAQLESLAKALKRAREVPPAFSPSLIAVRWLWRQLMDAKRLEEASELGAHASAVEERETTRHLANVDAENAARLASACVGHAKELQSLAASLASCERELAGAHARVGRKLTRPGVGAGDVIIAHAAVREDGLSPKLVPPSYPAIAAPDLVLAMRTAASAAGVNVREGTILTSDLFYPHDVLGSDLPLWQKAGVIAVEMEAATLFVVCALHGVEAGAVLAVDGNPLEQDEGNMDTYDPHRDIVSQAVEQSIRVGLEALIS